MKTPRRNFVVEYKSGRRRPTGQANSIWGKTDISSLIREAEAAHRFTQDIASDEMGQEDRERSHSALQITGIGDNEGLLQRHGSTPLEEAVPGDPPPIAGEVAFEDVQQLKAEPAQRQPRRRLKPARKVSLTPPVDSAVDVSGMEATVGASGVSFDELASLEAENRRLKLSLVNDLRKQNTQLRTMLERFDVV